MRTTDNARGKSRSPDKKDSARKSSADTSEPLSHPDLLTITIDTKTGQILKIEGANGSRARHELSDEEKASLAKKMGRATLEAIIEEAFEAGVACGLGEGADEDEPVESEEAVESEKDANLRHLLLRPLIENSAAKRLMRRDVLSRAILKTLIGHGTGARG
jgi:hypothetical protein